MPSWSIHLAIAKKVHKKLKLDKDIFYIGNLIPDIDFNNKYSRKETHYSNKKCESCPKEFLPNLKEFLKDYKENIKNNPLLIGYYSHLLTDYYYNNYIFSKFWLLDENNNVIGIKLNNKRTKICNIDIIKKYKHYDLNTYGKYLYNKKIVEIPKYNNEIHKHLKDLKENLCTNEDIINKITYLNTDFYKINKFTLKEKILGLKYKLFNKDELEKLMYSCTEFVLNNIKKINK